jgi:hypothetical protein
MDRGNTGQVFGGAVERADVDENQFKGLPGVLEKRKQDGEEKTGRGSKGLQKA